VDALFHLNAPLQQPQSGIADAMPVVQVGRRYLVSAVAGGMVIVDQHAAHERILYEQALGRLRSQADLPSQRLLLPESVELDPDSAAILSEQAGHMRTAGFEYSVEDGRAVVYAVPEGVGSGLEAFMEAVMVLGDPASMALSGVEKAAAAAACAGAVKFGEVIDQAAARQMLDTLFSTSEPFRCPHGRPTLIEIPFDELARRFGR
jgi:DNA mismatch repair protein MutL